MVARNGQRSVRKVTFGEVGKRRTLALTLQPEQFVPGQRTQAKEAAPFPQVEYPLEMRSAGGDLVRRRFVSRWRASHDRGDQHSAQHHSIVRPFIGRLIRGPGAMKGAKEPFPASIARKHSAGSIGSVRSGGQADDEPSRSRIAKGTYGPRPIILIGIGAPLFFTHSLTPLHKPWAKAAPVQARFAVEQQIFYADGFGAARKCGHLPDFGASGLVWLPSRRPTGQGSLDTFTVFGVY